MEFKTLDEATATLKEWQEILQLKDWSIHLSILSHEEMNRLANDNGFGDEKFAFGFSRVDMVNKFAHIYLHEYIPEAYMKDNFMGKCCQEHTLVHELCHVALPYPAYDQDNLECQLMWAAQHQRVEQFARALMMARYGGISYLDCYANF